MEIVLREVEISKLNLSPSDVLIVKLKGDRFSDEFIDNFGKHLKETFPNNKIELLCLDDKTDIIFEKIGTEGDKND